MHPLTPDLSKLTDDEIHTKRAELHNRLAFAYRMGQGDMINQLQLLLGDYDLEIQNRNRKMLNDAQKSGRFGSGDATDITR
jgi:hypothetical protein